MATPEVFDDNRECSSDAGCVECGTDASTTCLCGAALCARHFELQGGFCSRVTDDEHQRALDDRET